VTINDSSVDFKPKNIPGRIIIVLDSLKVHLISHNIICISLFGMSLINAIFSLKIYLQASSNLIYESPLFDAKLIVQNLDLMLVDDEKTINEHAISQLGTTIDVKKYWKVIYIYTYIYIYLFIYLFI